ncbi:Phosphatidylglycerol--membrane-oligosaccharide glycerophosphotransferase [Pseudoxanthomonas suwonensis 11-1]|uniref:Phosphatidylglycerol--membrane-oligosaccharide glycerophosphotransferase n=1 Tax=Pseudoxanthomonas suwonensis (strain 11-1) TaxID=743721 RepID=E6WQJ2_PSEUU|nr:phosphoglycerol transferase I [Pseudoxanthomonas suwonensis]ADV26441.1 Phosphatidylglycerol--membrane-oligosaccharide glycerophosphotransferase [Pseudoxanthomonas suwonensis 11-1]
MTGAVLVLALAAALALLLASPHRARTKAALLGCVLALLSLWWMVDRLSGDGLDAATLYHLYSGIEGAGVADFSGLLAATLVLLALSLLVPLFLARRLRRQPPPLRPRPAVFPGFLAAIVVAVVASPLAHDGWRLYQHTRPVDASRVAAEYVVPDRPLRERRNIVWIYAESLERTYFDESVFPGLMPNLTRLAGEALDFRQVASPPGTGWTIAGLVASLCGVPLTAARGDENSMGRMEQFLPGAHCLTDYLAQQGYGLHFSGGADSAFAAKDRFLASHGFGTVKDQAWFRERGTAKKHFSAWGVHDDVLLDSVYEDFLRLSRAGTPFMLTALTMDTHHPAGHLPQACRDVRYDSPHGDVGLLRAIACSDRLIGQLVERIRQSPHGEDTLVVIASDHLAMPNDLGDVLAGMTRENLLLFLGSGQEPRQVATRGSTLDTGATLLQLLDPELHELGFGRSLLAGDARPAASLAAREAPDRYPLYLGFARQLWTGRETRTLRIEDDRVVAGVQRIRPPVMLEYDQGWDIASIVLEDAPRQFAQRDPDNILAYVDRCTAFLDEPSGGEWCALVVDRNNARTLYAEEDLLRGIQVDAPLQEAADARPRPRRAFTVARENRKMQPGQYQLRMQARNLPSHSFWLEAVSDDGTVVRAREWVQVDPDSPGQQIRLPVWLDSSVDQLVIRAWLDYTEELEVDRVAVVRARNVAAAPRG